MRCNPRRRGEGYVRCSSCEPLLDAHLEVTLLPRTARAVAGHLRNCQSCRALLAELRVVDALLATARPAGVAANFTDSVISATRATRTRPPRRRMSLGLALFLYLAVAWVLVAFAVTRRNDLTGIAAGLIAAAQRSLAAIGALAHALAPATPAAAAAVTVVLLIDLFLLCAIFFGYRHLRPLLALYLARGPRQ
jgi:predicted anti-sigma-YlaC factor YlaD